MIKFFRNLRQNFLSEGKTGKYLKYAIGEIVLVVIGILIALSINNRNEYRKDRKAEQAVLIQLKEDFQTNLLQLEQKIEMRNKMIESSLKILNSIDNPSIVNRDSLISHLSIIDTDPTFDPIQNDLIESQKLQLIEDETLKRLLSNWTSDIISLQELEIGWSNKMTFQLEPIYGRLGISRDIANQYLKNPDHLWRLDNESNSMMTTVGNSKHKTTVEEIANNKELEGIVSDVIIYNKPANIQANALVARIHKILGLINQNIK